MANKQWTPIVDMVSEHFRNSVYSCSGQPCLKFGTYDRLDKINTFLKEKFSLEVTDVFYMSTQD